MNAKFQYILQSVENIFKIYKPLFKSALQTTHLTLFVERFVFNTRL